MQIKKNKKAVSVIVSYILLVGIVMGLSGMVYGWLKFKAGSIVAEESCPEGINLILESYNCSENGIIELTLKNKGFFTVSGFLIKMSDSLAGIPGMYPLLSVDTGKNILEQNITTPGTENCVYSGLFNYSKYGKIRQIEIEPIKNGAYCEKAIISQAVECP